MKPAEFWELTPAELYVMARGYKREQTRKTNDMIYVAWHTAVLSRQKQIPALKTLLISDREDRREQTTDDMLAMVKILNAAFGGEVIYV